MPDGVAVVDRYARGELERIKAILWIRAITPAPTPARAGDPLDDLRHLTPNQGALPIEWAWYRNATRALLGS
jgi:hypothetical protein